jgi:hypothetical protein
VEIVFADVFSKVYDENGIRKLPVAILFRDVLARTPTRARFKRDSGRNDGTSPERREMLVTQPIGVVNG